VREKYKESLKENGNRGKEERERERDKWSVNDKTERKEKIK
jgi:hypothetical protein